jgi:hypothetical protein
MEKNREQYRNKIFPVTYYRDNIENNEEIKNILMPVLNQRYENLQAPKSWLSNKVHTSFNNLNDDDELFFNGHNFYPNLLENAYTKCFDNFFDTEYLISIKEIWYNYYLQDEYQEWHDHLSSIFNPIHFACVHFLSYDNDVHKPTVFKDPINKLRDHSYQLEIGTGDQMYIPDIKEGDFIMFPSYLEHSVFPVKKSEKCPRVTISLNINLLKYGKKSYEL